MKALAYYAAFIPDTQGRYSVIFPDVLDCTTWGESLEDTLLMAIEALEIHLSGLADDNKVIPPASTEAEVKEKISEYLKELEEAIPLDMKIYPVVIPDIMEKPSRINVSFRKTVLTMIDKKAEQTGMSRSGFLARAAEVYNPTI